MTSKESIFISYRRSDSQDAVGRIDDYLTNHFGREHVFLDRNSIDYGTAFPERLRQALQDSKVMLVVMGSTWSSVKDAQGRQRLASPDDWVRQEIELALEMGLYVVPVLLDNTTMPSKAELPQTIQELADRNAIDLITRRSTNLFKAGMEEIIDLIEKRVPELKPAPPITLYLFEFEVVTVQIQSGLFGKKVIRQSQKKRARQYVEDLGNGVYLEMVDIPGGTFIMGSPSSEEGSSEAEQPQHKVAVQPFLMGKYPVTQKLWRTVADFPVVERELELNPSEFRGNKQPVENVNWLDAVEFCQRLSKKTGRKYRLPSEAEWEYACRAGSDTPFHFGETITPYLANYNGNSTYASGVKGIHRQEITDVGSFGVANAFGLFDMHGNVWEWCQDYWHDNYQNAPSDGTAWMTDGDPSYRLMRGGSWIEGPHSCRSAHRNNSFNDGSSYLSKIARMWTLFNGEDYASRSKALGFRVVCGLA